MSDDYIVLRNKKIKKREERVDVRKLRFFAENPRIYSAIGADQNTPTQDEIHEKLIRMDHVKELIHDIRLNGDLIDPIIVRDGTFEVLEGNSRLAAYRELIKQDPIKWGRMRSTILPEDLDDTTVFALLGQYHIKGKKDWLPYEQAGFLHRRHTRQSVDLETLSTELGLKLSEAKNLVATYDFMTEKEVRDPAKWSYFFEFIKSRKIKKHRREYENFDDMLVQRIKGNQVGTAMEFRAGLKLLGDANQKVVRKFVDGEYDLEDAKNAIQTSGNANEVYKRLNRFRMWLNKEETIDALSTSTAEERHKIDFELGKLGPVIRSAKRKLKR